MNEISPYWLGVFHKLHMFGVFLSIAGTVGSFLLTVFLFSEHYGNKKWLLIWIIPFMGALLLIFFPEIKK